MGVAFSGQSVKYFFLSGEFDMRVKSCVASDGAGHIIKLSDEFGCVLRPKMISRFLKARAPNEKATVITYAFFHAFKFPDALSVHIKCKVEICRHGCLDHCQLTGGGPNERKDTIEEDDSSFPTVKQHSSHDDNELLLAERGGGGGGVGLDDDDGGESPADVFYDDIIHNRDALELSGNVAAKLKQQGPMSYQQQQQHHQQQPAEVHEDVDDIPPNDQPEIMKTAESLGIKKLYTDDMFPHGPRHLEAAVAKDRIGMPAVAGPRSLNLDRIVVEPNESPKNNTKPMAESSGNLRSHRRRRRSVVVSDRHVRSADVGVSGLYEVISEADLAFSPDTKQEAVTVFQGQIGNDDIVYGICMPVPGFSVLFIVVVSAAIISALVAGSLLYRYQLQKEAFAMQNKGVVDADGNQMPAFHSNGTIASWMTMRLFRQRHCSMVNDSSGGGGSGGSTDGSLAETIQ